MHSPINPELSTSNSLAIATNSFDVGLNPFTRRASPSSSIEMEPLRKGENGRGERERNQYLQYLKYETEPLRAFVVLS